MIRPSGKGSWGRGGGNGGRELSTKHPTEHLDQRRKKTQPMTNMEKRIRRNESTLLRFPPAGASKHNRE